MNMYILLPVLGLIANISLTLYIAYAGLKNILNKLFVLVTLSLIFWSVSYIFVFAGPENQTVLLWVKVTTTMAIFTATFLLHFFFEFTKVFNKKYYLTLYIPAVIFVFLNSTTNLVTSGVELQWWGYAATRGPLYLPYALFLTTYVGLGPFLSFMYWKKSKDSVEKAKAILLAIAVSFPLIGGILTEILPDMFGLRFIPMTSTSSTITAVIIAYAMFKYKLMLNRRFNVGAKLVFGFAIVSITIAAFGYVAVESFKVVLTNKIGENSTILANKMIDTINLSINERLDDFETFSIDDNFQELLAGSNLRWEGLTEQERQQEIAKTESEWPTNEASWRPVSANQTQRPAPIEPGA